MADKSQRTEKATPKHKKEMREQGKVAKSAELGGWASLLMVASLLPQLGSGAAKRINSFVIDTTRTMEHPSLGMAVGLFGKGLDTTLMVLLPTILVIGALGVAISFAQVGVRFTPKAMNFKFSRISPKAGLKRMYSSEGLWNLGKTMLKLCVLAALGYMVMHQLIDGVLGGSTLPLQETLSAAMGSMVKLMRFIGGMALAIAIADYYFERRSYQQDLKMTRQEIKEEFRQNEGSPEMRRAVRSKARQLSRQQIMAAVARADVVVTNPTHFAVAIAYDRMKDRAPRVVAKGADFNALAIRERAKSCGVAIVENPPLARTLHASCEVDEVIPPKLYAAVAQLLAFVYSLSSTARVFNDVHRMSS